MFKNLSDKISRSIRYLIHRKCITEDDIDIVLNAMRVSLLEGDVSLIVVQNFINQVKNDLIGKKINKYLTPGQEFIKIMHKSLINIMEAKKYDNNLKLNIQNPTIFFIVGPQGSGKTTTVGKLAKFLKDKKNKKVLVTSVDTYRPAGMNQIRKLMDCENIDCSLDYNDKNQINLIQKAMSMAISKYYDVLLVDSPGCLSTDNNLFLELVKIKNLLNPIEILLVIDSMLGQASIDIINAFNNILNLTGIIMTKLDGNSKGGIALSIKYFTGKPIKFMGTGQTMDALEVFHPNRIVNRIFGMGDVLSLIEDIEMQTKKYNVKKHFIKENKHDFDLYDFLTYIKTIRDMGGVDKVFSKLPSLGIISNHVNVSKFDDKNFMRMENIIKSMTIKERMNPSIIGRSRTKRIAMGSGVQIDDVNNLLNQFSNIRSIMNNMNRKNIFNMMNNVLKNRFFDSFKFFK